MTLPDSESLKMARKKRLNGRVFRWVAGFLVLLGICVFLLWPTIHVHPIPTPTHIRMNDFRQFGFALHAYAYEHGTFPPAYIADENGRPLHSWRVLILPQIGEDKLYQAYNFDEPWDGPNNRKLLDRMPSIYGSPGYNRESRVLPVEHETNYVLPQGPQAICRGTKSLAREAISDGSDQTILLVEAKDPVCWMEPVDIAASEIHSKLNFTQIVFDDKEGLLVLFADGRTVFLPADISRQKLQALVTADAGD